MSRQARIFALLEAARSVPADDLAAELDVSRRTLASEVVTLQELLGTSAAIQLVDGRYRLLIADPPRYRAMVASVDDDFTFNDPNARASFIIARLFRAHVPLRTEELALAMAVGRTTVVTDLVRVRELLAGDGLSVEGRPNVGLEIKGPELEQRLHVLRRHFPVAYPTDDLQRRVLVAVSAMAAETGLDRSHVTELGRWATVCVDRARSIRHLENMVDRYPGLVSTPAHEFAEGVAGRLESDFGIELNDHERLFLTLPVAGMRAPSNPETAARFSGSADGDLLASEVLSAVRSEMEIDLSASSFLPEFARHLAAMLNRKRYQIWIDGSGVADAPNQFPVAYRMASLAAEVIEDRIGIPIDDAELGFLTTYFQVFLEGRERAEVPLQVTILATTGMVGAELVRLQLAKLLASSTRFEILSLYDATPEALAGADLVVVAGDGDVTTDVTVLHVSRVLDRGALARQLERVQLRVPMRSDVARGRSVLASSLDEQHFFVLPADTEYAEAVDFMTGHLEARGLVEPGFGDRIREREAFAQTQIDPWVGFPHAALTEQRDIMLSIGVIGRDRSEDGVRLIVLLGVPAASTRSEDVLVQVYDEVLRLGARRDLLEHLCQLTSFEEFYYFLEMNPTTER